MRRKIIGVILAVSVFAGSLTGCSLFTSKDRAAIEEKADTFISEMLKVRYERAARSVLDKDDDFMKSIPEDEKQLNIMEEVMYNSTYELGEIEVHKFDKEATCRFTVSYTDVIALTSDGDMPMADVIAAIGDGQEITETELTVSFIYDDDEWSVDPDSATEIIEFFADMCEDLPLSGINEDSALEYAQEFIGMIADGSFTEAIGMTTLSDYDFESALSIYYSDDDTQEISPIIDEMQAAYYSTFQPTYSVQRIDDDTYAVTATGEISDVDTGLEAIKADEDRFVPILVELLAPLCVAYDPYAYDDGYDLTGFYTAYKDFFIEGLSETTDTVIKEIYMEISSDDYGNYTIDLDEDDIFPSTIGEFYLVMDDISDDAMLAACEILHDDGRMTDELYLDAVSEYWETDLPPGLELQVLQDDGIYSEVVFFEGSTVNFIFETWDYYMQGDSFRYTLTLDGEPLVEDGIYEVTGSYSENIFIQYDLGDEEDIPMGVYDLTIYEEGVNVQDVLCQVQIVPEGTTPSGGSTRFG
ncbi:MAG: hypothetical protein II718_01130 [Clostridiales bacterium]|nr:hypothetical protein [Clostridiales bacterium]